MKERNTSTRIDLNSKFLAFAIFHEKGIAAVIHLHPDQLDFVEKNKEKSLREVKNELCGESSLPNC